MCLATAYVQCQDKEELCMKNVETIKVAGDCVRLADVLSRQIEIKGTIKEINLTDNLIYIQAEPQDEA